MEVPRKALGERLCRRSDASRILQGCSTAALLLNPSVHGPCDLQPIYCGSNLTSLYEVAPLSLLLGEPADVPSLPWGTLHSPPLASLLSAASHFLIAATTLSMASAPAAGTLNPGAATPIT